VDFYLSGNRDVEAAKQFLRKAMKNQRAPTKITLDAYAASHRAVTELKDGGELPKRVPGAIQQVSEQHDRADLKSFAAAAVTISGIELAEKIRKRQFKTGKLGGRTARVPEIWQAALAA